MLIEGLRTDSLYLWNTSIRVSQLIGFCSVIIGFVLFILLMKKNKANKLAEAEYSPMFEKESDENKANVEEATNSEE